jgi:hypothetical protein
MARPRIYEDLVTTSVTVDKRQLDLAKAQGINISELMRDALTLALGSSTGRIPMPRAKSKIRGVPVHLKNKALKFVQEDPRVAGWWANLINDRCATELQGQDLLELIPVC